MFAGTCASATPAASELAETAPITNSNTRMPYRRNFIPLISSKDISSSTQVNSITRLLPSRQTFITPRKVLHLGNRIGTPPGQFATDGKRDLNAVLSYTRPVKRCWWPAGDKNESKSTQ